MTPKILGALSSFKEFQSLAPLKAKASAALLTGNIRVCPRHQTIEFVYYGLGNVV